MLDINLKGEPVFPVAETLASRGIPYIFATGYDRSALPPDYRDVARFEKPYDVSALAKALAQIVKRNEAA